VIRVRKIVEEYDGSSWSETLDRKFVWYNWLLLVELDGEDDSVLKKYTWGADLSGQKGNVAASPRGGRLDGAGGIGGLLATRDEADSKSYVHFYDGNGNTGQLILRADASTAARYEYDAYGSVTASSGGYADDNAWRFSTKYWDEETGLGYWGYRYYEAYAMGRWLSRDPLDELGRALLRADDDNRDVQLLGRLDRPYLYAANSPPLQVDPTGLDSIRPQSPEDAETCRKAKEQGLDLVDPPLDPGRLSGGGVICRKGKKVSCSWLEPSGSKRADSIMNQCMLVHEDRHHNSVTCEPCPPTTDPDCCPLTRPPFDPGVNPDGEECDAYAAEIRCLGFNRRRCGTDRGCLDRISVRIGYLRQDFDRRCRNTPWSPPLGGWE
jgi:RHS repeat-associated protein